jgi:hypothetical protein
VKPVAMVVGAGRMEVGEEADEWAPRSHLSAREGGGGWWREAKRTCGRGREGAGPAQRQRGESLICFLFILIDLMNFVLLKLFIELRKFTENSGEYIRAQRILQNIPGQ